MRILLHSTTVLSIASKGNPAIASVTIAVFCILCITLSLALKRTMFGVFYLNIYDATFVLFSLFFLANTVVSCAAYNINKTK